MKISILHTDIIWILSISLCRIFTNHHHFLFYILQILQSLCCLSFLLQLLLLWFYLFSLRMHSSATFCCCHHHHHTITFYLHICLLSCILLNLCQGIFSLHFMCSCHSTLRKPLFVNLFLCLPSLSLPLMTINLKK